MKFLILCLSMILALNVFAKGDRDKDIGGKQIGGDSGGGIQGTRSTGDGGPGERSVRGA
ncbi:MAG: hypothetical protein HOE90_05985 [Bacteriovoracaceae bacterium]|jgi:hypothetical protein|nr:hypothetical protein [Bacteriovoracaceae bacterium]